MKSKNYELGKNKWKPETILKRKRARVWREDGVQEIDKFLKKFVDEYKQVGINNEELIKFGSFFMECKEMFSSIIGFYKLDKIFYDIVKYYAKNDMKMYELAILIFKKICCITFGIGVNLINNCIRNDKKLCYELNSIFKYKRKFGTEKSVEWYCKVNNTNKNISNKDYLLEKDKHGNVVVVKSELNLDVNSIDRDVNMVEDNIVFEIKEEVNNIENKDVTVTESVQPYNFNQISESSPEYINESDDEKYSGNELNIPECIFGEYIKTKVDGLKSDFTNLFCLSSLNQKRLGNFLNSYLRYFINRKMDEYMYEYMDEYKIKSEVNRHLIGVRDFFLNNEFREEYFNMIINRHITPEELSTWDLESYSHYFYNLLQNI
ncbi:Hypothetical protein SRAE_2000465400 [Strongyloides ratti]|uniref:Uncharacterized protein n=1 Tax=Strongyloides ratti TaxID=34506 RepID=A0A090LJK2_STRRB|nr:Hypothetical protein SRAE_2000465400 [Strongyloides ratti]CEF70012.2 Hypothetical protein SRAE_2000465400 [Strongyloides ratti]